MPAGLEEITGNLKVDLGKATFIGRTGDSQLCLMDDKVSRQHAMVRRQGNDFWLYDLGSANGTFINGHLANVALKLSNGDQISIGDHQFVFVEYDGLHDDSTATLSEPTRAQIQLTPMLILVSDIKGFTEISESIPPEILAKSIGAWYRECERVIAKFGGTVDKFIGDAVLAYWTDTSSKARQRATRAAAELNRTCQEITKTHGEAFRRASVSLAIGTALHFGNVAHGSMSQGTFTLLGDAVNVTFRLESLTRKLGKDILVTREFLIGWNEGLKQCHQEGPQLVKGRRTPLDVYSLASVSP